MVVSLIGHTFQGTDVFRWFTISFASLFIVFSLMSCSESYQSCTGGGECVWAFIHLNWLWGQSFLHKAYEFHFLDLWYLILGIIFLAVCAALVLFHQWFYMTKSSLSIRKRIMLHIQDADGQDIYGA